LAKIKIFLLILISIALLLSALIISCATNNPGNAEIIDVREVRGADSSIEETAEESEVTESGQEQTYMQDEEGEKEDIVETFKETSVEETSPKTEKETEDSVSPDKIKYEEMAIKVTSQYADYVQLENGTVSFTLEKGLETGIIDGYVLIGFTELFNSEGEGLSNTSVLKAQITGTADFKDYSIYGYILGDLNAESSEYFEGKVKLEVIGEFIGSEEFIKLQFFTPAMQVFDILMKRTEA